MRILFDQGTPAPLIRYLPGHEVTTAEQAGWDRADDGDLLAFAEQAGFEVLITTDKSLPSQQNLKKYRISVLVLGNSRWPIAQRYVRRIASAVASSSPGTWREIQMPSR